MAERWKKEFCDAEIYRGNELVIASTSGEMDNPGIYRPPLHGWFIVEGVSGINAGNVFILTVLDEGQAGEYDIVIERRVANYAEFISTGRRR